MKLKTYKWHKMIIEWKQACTEMVMPMSCSNQSMLPPYENDSEAFQEQCMTRYGVKPRPHWITTEFGGMVSFFLPLHWISFFGCKIQYPALWSSFAEDRDSTEEIWKQHHILQWNAGPLEPWRVSGTTQYYSVLVLKQMDYFHQIFRVLKNISSSIVALVTKKGKHFCYVYECWGKLDRDRFEWKIET